MVRLRLERNSEKASCAATRSIPTMRRTKWASEGASLRVRRDVNSVLAVILADLDQRLLKPPQVAGRERLVGSETMNHDVVQMVLQVLLHLFLVLDPGHLR